MKHILLIAPLLIASPAFAQQVSQPSDQALIQTLHQQLADTENQLTIVEAELLDQQRLNSVLQQKSATTVVPPQKDQPK